MPLIDFKTDLTSLKYGLDRPGGGYSGQPYIQFPIDNIDAPTNIRRYYELNRTSLDFPIRGGAIEALINGNYSALAATVDRRRIEQFFKDAPRGTTFIQKQIGLGLTNPRTQVPNTLTFAGSILQNAVLPVTQTYNPLNTLAQVQVQGTGAHFNRQGVIPTITESLRQTYEYLAGAPQNNTTTTNRLLILKALKLDAQSGFNPTRDAIINTGVDPVTIDRLGISPISNQLFNYPGGPGSVYGIGTTRIFRTTNTEPEVAPLTQTPYSAIALTYAQLASQNTHVATSPTVVTIQDFRQQTNLDNPIITNTDYGVYNIAKPFDGNGGLNIGNPGGPLNNLNRSNFLFSKPGAADTLNALKPYYYDSDADDPWTAGGHETKDIIKFVFECLSNDNPGYAIALVFRAFLDGAISDNNTAEYNAFRYLGRGENFRTYQGFDRSISFNFKLFAQTREELGPVYTKLNHLISQTYPDYSPESNLMRGSVVRLTIGDYIYRMHGFIETVNVTIDNSTTPWEIQLLGDLYESDVAQVPHVISVQVTFKPIMDQLPARVTMNNPDVSLIANTPNGLFLRDIVDKTPAPQTTIPQDEEIVIVDEDARIPAIQLDASGPVNNNQKTKPLKRKAAKQAAAKSGAKARSKGGPLEYYPNGPQYGVELYNEPKRTAAVNRLNTNTGPSTPSKTNPYGQPLGY